MSALLRPRWFLATHTLPLLLLIGLGVSQYTLIESLLEPGEHIIWLRMALFTAAALLAGFAVVMVLDAWGVRSMPWGGLLVFYLSNVGLLLYLLYHAEAALSWRVPDWLRVAEPYVLVSSCLIPSIMHTLMAVIVRATSLDGNTPWRAVGNVLGALGVPVGCYALGAGLAPLFPYGAAGSVGDALFPVVIVAAITLFYFLLLRGIYLIAAGRWSKRDRSGSWIGVFIGLVLPGAGLLTNQMLFEPSFNTDHGVFGNFSHPAFFAVAVVNGICLNLPRRGGLGYRITLYLAACAGLTYVAYFAVVFLPILPFGLLGVFALGLGLLVLTPLVLLVYQLACVLRDFAHLRRELPFAWLVAGGLLALGVLPAALSVDYFSDRQQLDRALDYVYAPAASDGRPPAGLRMRRALRSVRALRERDAGSFIYDGRTVPYLSSYYNWLVLDNLTISSAKLTTLERVFFDRQDHRPYGREDRLMARPTIDRPPVELTVIESTTDYDPNTGTYSSWVDLTMRMDSLGGTGWQQGEYQTTFTLPPGTYVDDYYLNVGERREPGILAERRAATWVYNQIAQTRRDPGLLRYTSPNELQLNVFPFAPGEERRTGFRLLHRDYVDLSIDGKSRHLRPRTNVNTAGSPPIDLDPGLIYLSQYEKARLPKTVRAPRMVRIRKAATEGGFFAQRRIEEVLQAMLASPDLGSYPVILIEGDHPIFTDGFAAFAAALPNHPYIYWRHESLGLLRHALTGPFDSGWERARLPTESYTVASYVDRHHPLTIVPIDGQPGLLLHPDFAATAPSDPTTDPWTAAARLHATYLANERAGRRDHATWLAGVRGSFRHGILTPLTAYLVVENDAQKEALYRKQKEVLHANPKLDLGEEPREMPEPEWLWVVVLLGLLVSRVPAKGRRV